MHAVEPWRPEQTVTRMAALYEAVGPRLGCTLVEAEVLLLLAGLRAQTDLLLFDQEDGDAAAVERLNRADADLHVKIVEEDARHQQTGRRMRVLILESLAGYAYVSTHIPLQGITPFDPTEGWEGVENWGKEVFDFMRASDTEDLALTRWIGFTLGYPARAIEDACEAIRTGQSFDTLAHADILAVYRYGGAMPIFSFASAHADDPEIVATCTNWQALLEGVYESRWHQLLAADPAFQAARQARR